MNKLKYLSLSHNKLTVIPNEIERLVKLKDLDLYHNNISVIPNTMKYLSKLETLKIHDNNLTSLPVELIRLRKLLHVSVDHGFDIPNELLYTDKVVEVGGKKNQ